MNPEDYVSYPLALALKKHGFDWKCDHCYAKTDESKHELVGMTVSRDYNKPRDGEPPFLTPICSAVPLWQAQKWLRDKKKIDIELRVWLVGDTREYRPYIMPPKKHDFIAYPPEKSYESALSAGIVAALELIENNKNN